MDAGLDGLPGHHALGPVERERSFGSDPVITPNLQTAVKTVGERNRRQENATISPVNACVVKRRILQR